MELRLHQRLEAVCGAEGLLTAAFCSEGDALAVGSRDGVLGLWTALPGLPQETVKEAAARFKGGNRSSFGEDFRYYHNPLAKPMMHVTPNGVKNSSQTADDRKSLQNSAWFVRSDLRSLSGTAGVFDRNKTNKTMKFADRERGNKPSPVTPNIRAKLMAGGATAGLPRRKSLAHDGGDVGDDDEMMQKSSSTPELKRWKPTGHEAVFQDVLSAYCNATGTPSNMSKTLPNMSNLGAKSSAFNSTCWGADADFTPNEPTPASMRTSVIKHAAQGVVKRVTLEPQSIC